MEDIDKIIYKGHPAIEVTKELRYCLSSYRINRTQAKKDTRKAS